MLPVSSLSSPVYTLTSLPLDLQPLNNNTNFSISYLAKNKTTRLSSACDINDGFTHSDKAFACSKCMFAKKTLSFIKRLAGSIAPQKGDMVVFLPSRT